MNIFILDTTTAIVSACKNIPCPVFNFTKIIVGIIKNIVPLIIIVMGMIDFGKATMASSEDEMAKSKKQFTKRLAAGASVFLVVSVVQLGFNMLGDNASPSGQVFKCASDMISGKKLTDDEIKSGTHCNNDEFGKPAEKKEE